MYVIAIYYRGEFTKNYVSMVNYKRDLWDSSERPKIFKTLKSVEKAKVQVKKYATAVELKTYELKVV